MDRLKEWDEFTKMVVQPGAGDELQESEGSMKQSEILKHAAEIIELLEDKGLSPEEIAQVLKTAMIDFLKDERPARSTRPVPPAVGGILQAKSLIDNLLFLIGAVDMTLPMIAMHKAAGNQNWKDAAASAKTQLDFVEGQFKILPADVDRQKRERLDNMLALSWKRYFELIKEGPHVMQVPPNSTKN